MNAKGRRTLAQPFVMLANWTFDCPAYRSLKPGPRALLWEMIRRYNGTNNGRIAFSQRDMSTALNVKDRETVAGYVRELEARQFIIAKRRGAFHVKAADCRASEWVLTMLPMGDQPPTKDFMRWRAEKIDGTEKPASRGGNSVPVPVESVRQRPNVRVIPSRTPPLSTDRGTENPSTYTSIAIGSGAKVHGNGRIKASHHVGHPTRHQEA